MKIPEAWTMQQDEVSAGVYRIIATADDGRRIEATGSNEERLKDDVIRAIATSDIQVADRRVQ